MSDTPTKNISIKFIGSERPAEVLSIEPGTSVADCLRSVGLGGAGFTLSDPHSDTVLRPTDNLYAIATDGALYAASAQVDAGIREVAA